MDGCTNIAKDASGRQLKAMRRKERQLANRASSCAAEGNVCGGFVVGGGGKLAQAGSSWGAHPVSGSPLDTREAAAVSLPGLERAGGKIGRGIVKLFAKLSCAARFLVVYISMLLRKTCRTRLAGPLVPRLPARVTIAKTTRATVDLTVPVDHYEEWIQPVGMLKLLNKCDVSRLCAVSWNHLQLGQSLELFVEAEVEEYKTDTRRNCCPDAKSCCRPGDYYYEYYNDEVMGTSLLKSSPFGN